MSSINTIAAEKLARLIGTPKCPTLIDLRVEEDFLLDPRFIPNSLRRSYETVDQWAPALNGRPLVDRFMRSAQRAGDETRV